MFFAVRRLSRCPARRIVQTRWLCSARIIKKYPYLIKAVQGSSKDPHHQPVHRLGGNNRFGEDSWFISSTPKAEVMGVADGVGGWRKVGIDAGIFAKELMYWCSNNAQRAEFDGRNPRQLLIDSFNQMRTTSADVLGSSTACLVALKRSDCTLHTANLGDSGFLVLRNGKVVLRSDEQHHGFNTPYQLAMPSSERQNNSHSDEPEQAISSHMPLQQGDLVLLATDGLFDNVPESMLVRHLGPVHGETQKEQLQLVANNLVALASDLSLSPNFQSPFALKARANNINYGPGGKPDDITLILASVAVHNK
ncbi:protein phosphatase PTC7 homolog fig [Drosophila innubila]|uniref:protein phosphatase PTC7 homolog fig n=1 Tax=Drosophila innubila TaxID=198719 RepID=UPI00148B8B8D|nr:protein phosphatase PTC7 homolog fig [Drosophila innubila]